MAFFEALGNWLWGGPLLAAFLIVGLWYSFGSGFFQIFGLSTWWRATAGSLLRRSKRQREGRGVTQLQALSTALAATIGTGSIAGVSTAIMYGGPGAVFWMWMSALLGMAVSCGEKTLAVRHREKGPDGRWRGGPMEYMKNGLRLPGLAKIFALFCIAETLAGGNLAQANSISTALSATVGASPAAVGVVLAAVTAIVLAGGVKRIGRLCELLVPAMALLFVGGGLAVVAVNWRTVPWAFRQIIDYAFSPRALAGGYAMGTALRYGVARGVFTNEAGLGMSSIAHACADVEEPAEQGMWGIFEVFFATMVVCTVTALVILTSGVYDPLQMLPLVEAGAVPDGMLGAPLTVAGFATLFGEAGEWIVSVSLILFAFTSLIGAGYYGQRGLETLTGARWVQGLYKLAFPVCVIFGAVGDVTAVWQLVDVFNGLLAAINLPALLLLSPEALHLLRVWLLPRKKKREKSAQSPLTTEEKML